MHGLRPTPKAVAERELRFGSFLLGIYTHDASDITNPLLAAHPTYYAYRWYLVDPNHLVTP